MHYNLTYKLIGKTDYVDQYGMNYIAPFADDDMYNSLLQSYELEKAIYLYFKIPISESRKGLLRSVDSVLGPHDIGTEIILHSIKGSEVIFQGVVRSFVLDKSSRAVGRCILSKI